MKSNNQKNIIMKSMKWNKYMAEASEIINKL